MSFVNSIYIDCPACGRLVESSTWKCPFCGADIDRVLEERQIAKRYLRYFSVSIWGGILLSVAVLVSLGALPDFSSVLIPVWAAIAAIAGVLWLVAERFDPPSPHRRGAGHEKLQK